MSHTLEAAILSDTTHTELQGISHLSVHISMHDSLLLIHIKETLSSVTGRNLDPRSPLVLSIALERFLRATEKLILVDWSLAHRELSEVVLRPSRFFLLWTSIFFLNACHSSV